MKFPALSLKGISKVGDVLITGDQALPAFSEVQLLQHLPRISDYMYQEDRQGLMILCALLGLMPKFMICLLFSFLEKHNAFPVMLASPMRQVNLGLRGIVFTLYYSHLDDGKIFNTLNYQTGIYSKISEDVEMEQLMKNQNPLAQRSRSAIEAEIAALTVKERLQFTEKIRQVILKRQDEIVEIIQKETSKARTDILTSELFPLFEHLDFLKNQAEKALKDETVPTPIAMMGKKSVVWHEPLGTVLVISPWNYPFYQAITPITCSFITGNATIYKPSELTPLKGLVESILAEAGMKPDWVQIFYGDGKLGSELIDQKPQKIFFTGSVATGKKIMAQASQHLIPVELELGGKDPMLVFSDVNLERAVKGAIWGAFTNSGQSCTSVERLYVEEAIYPVFKQRLVEETLKLKLGVDKDGNSDIGAMISEKQVQIVAELVKDAVAHGATMLTGSEWDFQSKMIPPIILEGTTHEMRINQEEIFGPVLPLMSFKTEAEAIKLANDSQFGLSASVWSKDKVRAERVSRALVTGNISINNVMVSEGNHDLPFGGVKDSGIGRYKGIHGLRSFCNIKSVMIDADSKKIEANWYPYTTKKFGLFNGLIQSLFGGGIGKWVGLISYGLPLESEAKKERK